jgi:hypothetical protein
VRSYFDEDFILTIDLKDANEKQAHIANDFDITISGGPCKMIPNYTKFNFYIIFFLQILIF